MLINHPLFPRVHTRCLGVRAPVGMSVKKIEGLKGKKSKPHLLVTPNTVWLSIMIPQFVRVECSTTVDTSKASLVKCFSHRLDLLCEIYTFSTSGTGWRPRTPFPRRSSCRRRKHTPRMVHPNSRTMGRNTTRQCNPITSSSERRKEGRSRGSRLGI